MDFSFESRLNFILQDRKQTPWGKELGFTGASISHIFSGGRIPGPEFLYAIRRAENVNLNWLLTGEGNPYIVDYFQSADALCDYVVAMLEDESWQVYVFSDNDTVGLVLSQPGQYEFKGKRIDYTILHILVGPGNDSLIDVLKAHKENGNSVLVPMVTDREMQLITSGSLGTYQLFHAVNPVLNPLTAIEMHDLQFRETTQKENSVSIPILRTVLRITAELETKHEIELSAEQKARVIAVVYKQVSRLDLDILPDQAVIAAVEAAFDMLVD